MNPYRQSEPVETAERCAYPLCNGEAHVGTDAGAGSNSTLWVCAKHERLLAVKYGPTVRTFYATFKG